MYRYHLGIVFAVGTLFGFSTQSRADLIDQTNIVSVTTTFLPGTLSIPTSNSGEFGQEFTPTLSGIDWVEFGFRHVVAGNPADLMTVTLRLGDTVNHDLDGTILGTATTTIPAGLFDSMVRLNFSSTVALTPGTLYAFEVQATVDFNTIIWGHGAPSTYSGGTAIANNTTSFGTDLVFQEGMNDPVAVPEPASLLLCGAAAVGGAFGWWRKRRAMSPAAL